MIDPECAICCSLHDAEESLAKIVRHIEWSCTGTRKQSDFGLSKANINEQIVNINKMKHWHEYHHATGESLMEKNSDVNSGNDKPRRWRKA
jgi:hypothetical protein